VSGPRKSPGASMVDAERECGFGFWSPKLQSKRLKLVYSLSPKTASTNGCSLNLLFNPHSNLVILRIPFIFFFFFSLNF
jgi:hypothetical protein